MIEEIKSLLPTPLTKGLASLFCLLLPLAFQAPQFLRPLFWPKLTDRDLVLLQIIATVFVLFIELLVMCFIVRYIKEPKSFWETKNSVAECEALHLTCEM